MGNITSKWNFESRDATCKAILTAACLALYFSHVGFYDGCPLANHLLYSFCHANPFHMLINLMALWSIKNRLPMFKAILVGILASFLPMFVSDPTMGLSGFLFAAFGIMWGKTGRWREAMKKVMPFIICTMIIPNVNGLLHLYAFSLGYILEYLLVLILRSSSKLPRHTYSRGIHNGL